MNNNEDRIKEIYSIIYKQAWSDFSIQIEPLIKALDSIRKPLSDHKIDANGSAGEWFEICRSMKKTAREAIAKYRGKE